MKRELSRIQNGDFGRFPFLGNLDREAIGQFSYILKSLIVNLTVRFYDVGASLSKRTVRRFLDYDGVRIRQEAPIGNRPVCGVPDILGVFHMKDVIVAPRLFFSLAHLGLGFEWRWFMGMAMDHSEAVVGLSHARIGRLSSRERQVRDLLQTPVVPNLIEAFGVVPRWFFPILWLFVVRTLTIMPTTVACEQAFSYFKRTLHTNMSEETARNLLFSRLSLYKSSFKL